MISIIISSYQDKFYSALEKSIAKTIGVAYEIIKIDNPNIMGLCEAYNKGASKSQYDFLLFIHEDVIFHTKNWGNLLINHLQKENIGVIGVAGSNYVPKAPIGWHLPDNRFNFLNLIQNNKSTTNPKLFSNIITPKHVFAIDGVFMALKKSIYLDYFFDESLKGFHGYDLDFSLRIAQKYQNLVVNDILIEHFSIGNPDLEWFNANVYVRKKNNYKYNKLDVSVEKLTFQIFLNIFFKYNKITFKNIFSTLTFLSCNLFLDSYFEIVKTYLYHIKNKNSV